MAEHTADSATHDGYSHSLEFTLSICLCYTLCILGLRLYIRWRAFGVDDLIILISTAPAFAFFGCSYASKAAGFARPMETLIAQHHKIDSLNALALGGNLSWITALCLSKLAIVSILIHTTPTAAHRRVQYTVGALIAVQWISSITLMTARCTGFDGFAWDFRSNDTACSRQELRWRVITGLDIATEIAILSLPLQLVWSLQMSAKNKVIVVAAFWLRIPALVFTIFRNGATNDLRSSADISLTAAMVVIWQAIEMSYSIAAATIVALKRFTESLNTGFGHGELIRVHGQSQSYRLSDRSASLKDSRDSEPPAGGDANHIHQGKFRGLGRDGSLRQLKLRPDDTQNEAKVYSMPKHFGGGRTVAHNRHSEDKIIRHDVRYSVRFDEETLVSG